MAQSYVYGAISDTEMGNGVEREAPDVHESCDSGKEHDRIELVSGSTTARPKTGGRKLTNIEISTLLAVYAILLFAVGIVLFGDWSSGNPESEFTFGEGYTMCLMLVSLVWMFRGPLKLAWVRKRRGETSKQSGEDKETQVQSLLVKTLSLFAAVSLLFTFVQIIDVALLVGKCRTPVAICSDVVKLIFIPCQVCLIVYSKNKNLLQKSLFTGFMVMQIVVTNMILYIWTFIKSKANFFPLAFQSRCPHVVGSLAIEIAHNRSTATPNLTSSHCEPTIFNKLFPWFYPFCLEFCLTASAMLAEQLFESIRESALKERDTHETTNEDENRNLQLEIPVETTEVSVTAAVVIGIFALVAHFGVIGILTLEHNSNVATALWYGGEGITAMTITVASLVGLITLSKYQNSLEKSEVPIDEILIVLGSVGALTLSLFRGFPGLVDLGGDDRAYATGVLLCQMVVTLATILQTIFIVIALHSKSEKRGWINVASLATFMGLMNVSVWVTNTIDIDGMDLRMYPESTYKTITKLQEDRYGQSWNLFLVLCFPLAVFFRIHSAVVLYRISKLHQKVPDLDISTARRVSREVREYVERKKRIGITMSELKKEEEELQRQWADYEERNKSLLAQHSIRLKRVHSDFKNEISAIAKTGKKAEVP